MQLKRRCRLVAQPAQVGEVPFSAPSKSSYQITAPSDAGGCGVAITTLSIRGTSSPSAPRVDRPGIRHTARTQTNASRVGMGLLHMVFRHRQDSVLTLGDRSGSGSVAVRIAFLESNRERSGARGRRA